MLSPFRVLDLTDEKGHLCGKVLGDIGADVIKVEPLAGDVARQSGPVYETLPPENRSIPWLARNTSKRGITLNLDCQKGIALFRRLCERADCVVESFPPGYLDKIGAGYSALKEINPRLILTSITPFGQTGPYKDYQMSDLVAMAMGGLMYVVGDPDRAPVRIGAPQAYSHAASQAATGTLLALFVAEQTGEGQWVDVSIQASLPRSLVVEMAWWELHHKKVRRTGPKIYRIGLYQSQLWPCKDGHVCLRIMGGAYSRGVRALLDWIKEEGTAGSLTDFDDRFFVRFRRRNFHTLVDSAANMSGLGERNQTAVKKTTSGLLKLLFPHRTAYTIREHELAPCLTLASECRQRVIDQLAVLLPGEFMGVRVAASVAQ